MSKSSTTYIIAGASPDLLGGDQPIFWFDAGLGITKDGGDDMISWADQSGNSRDVTDISSPSHGPSRYYSTPEIGFLDSRQGGELAFASTISSGTFGIHMVVSLRGGGTGPILRGEDSPGNTDEIGFYSVLPWDPPYFFAVAIGGISDIWPIGGVEIMNNYFVYSVVRGPLNTVNVWKNGIPLEPDEGTIFSEGNIQIKRIGGPPGLLSGEWNRMRIKEIVAYRSGSNRVSAENYLNTKYGIF